ncbi:hypothetical protein [Caballeronia sp.]|uniref:hypothetical protein n=1 Tax=Caballeronia sp. TaxID=1931223 RepID=UPI003C6A1F91
MASDKIMIIRHAEKPAADGSVQGVTAAGATNAEELIVRGWQRSGALVRFFAPLDGEFAQPGLATPNTIFTSQVAHHSASLRPQHTVLELATLLGTVPGFQFNTQYPKGDESSLVTAAMDAQGPVLIAWEHQAIPAIVKAIVGNSTPYPPIWPDRFDLVWILDRQAAGAWEFSQVPQLLLSGDSPQVVPI